MELGTGGPYLVLVVFDLGHVGLEPSDPVLPAGLVLPQGRVHLFLLIQLLQTAAQALCQLLYLERRGRPLSETVHGKLVFKLVPRR